MGGLQEIEVDRQMRGADRPAGVITCRDVSSTSSEVEWKRLSAAIPSRSGFAPSVPGPSRSTARRCDLRCASPARHRYKINPDATRNCASTASSSSTPLRQKDFINPVGGGQSRSHLIATFCDDCLGRTVQWRERNFMADASWYYRKADECARIAAASADPRHRSSMEEQSKLWRQIANSEA